MDRLHETGVSAGIHVEVLAYEANLLTEHVSNTPGMSEFSKMVNLAVQQYFIDRIEIITQENT